MKGSAAQPQPQPNPKKHCLKLLLGALSGDEDEYEATTNTFDRNSSSSSSLSELEVPWLQAYRIYLGPVEQLPDGMGLIEWWGVHERLYPIWASLAHDYLPIMGSSVSSERAFSSSGITISKRRNRLKGDVVEALQVVKSALRNDLFARDHVPSSSLELEIIGDGKGGSSSEVVIDLDSDQEVELDNVLDDDMLL
jgi:hypothetical protein